MERTGTCPLEQQLTKLKSCAKSKGDFHSILLFLKVLISDLINNPLDGKYKIMLKREENFLSNFLNPQEIREFLTLLGYHEEEDCYVHHTSDQNMKILEGCLILLECCKKQQDSNALSEVCENETGESLSQKSICSKTDPSVLEESKVKDMSFSAKIKNCFLMKHQKKECNGFFSFLKCEPKKKAPECAFNANGYFLQTCNNREASEQQGVIKDLFHPQERGRKKWGFCSSHKKLT